MRKRSLILFLILFSQSTAWAVGTTDRFRAIKAAEPDFRTLFQAFLEKGDLEPAEWRQWQKRMRVAPYLPTLYVGYDHQLRKAESLSVQDNISVTSGIVTVGPEDNDYDLDNNLGQAVRVRAVWRLDEIVFNRDSFALATSRRQDVRLREQMRERLYKIYEERYLILTQYLSWKGRSPARAALYYTRYLTLTDQLNEYTDNRFAVRFWREK